MHGGKAQRDTSIYSILLHRFHFLLSNCGPSIYEVIEPILLRWALSESPLTSLLASDVLCFLVRVSPPDVGWNVTLAMAQLFQRVVEEGVKKDGKTPISGAMLGGLKVDIVR